MFFDCRYGKSWKALFFDMLFSARRMWEVAVPAVVGTEEVAAAPEPEARSYQIQVRSIVYLLWNYWP